MVLDYAHNKAAMAALGEAVASLDKRRTVMVMGLPGDRRDEDLIASRASHPADQRSLRAS